jgi:hypothetical protein
MSASHPSSPHPHGFKKPAILLAIALCAVPLLLSGCPGGPCLAWSPVVVNSSYCARYSSSGHCAYTRYTRTTQMQCTRWGKKGDKSVAKPGDKPSSTKECRAHKYCKLLGNCHYVKGKCVAKSDADCLTTFTCKHSGDCHAYKGRCGPRDDSDCRRSKECPVEGKCSFHEESSGFRRCVPKAASDCRDSQTCRIEGKCVPHRNRYGTRKCIPGAPADCRKSENCAKHGLCMTSYRLECLAGTQANCQQSAGCREHGKCYMHKYKCSDLTDNVCKTMPACKKLGHCSVDKSAKRCVLKNDSDCRRIRPRPQGAGNFLVDGRCVPATDAICQKRFACEHGGFCHASANGSKCENRGRASCMIAACAKWGHCKIRRGKCVANSDANCRRSAACRKYGQCHEYKGQCVPNENIDCSRSIQCRTDGKCVYYRHPKHDFHWCIATKRAHCLQSEACKKSGRCRLHKNGRWCVK